MNHLEKIPVEIGLKMGAFPSGFTSFFVSILATHLVNLGLALEGRDCQVPSGSGMVTTTEAEFTEMITSQPISRGVSFREGR